MNDITLWLVLCDLRGAGNVGAILRTADATSVTKVFACGYTPYPRLNHDPRPPHVIASNARAIAKSALGAEQSLNITHVPDAFSVITEAKALGFEIIVLEQAETSLSLFKYPHQAKKVALIVGNETEGVAPGIQATSDAILEIPMLGAKESLNVASATAIALYQLRFGQPLTS